jgi:hypothetical protein
VGAERVRPTLRRLSADSSAILQHVVVPEPENSPSLPPEIGVSLLIATVGVLSAIRFDDEFCLKAGEIHDVWWDRMLSPKTAPEPIVTKFSPQRAFRRGHVPTQTLTARRQRRSSAHRPHPDPPPPAGEGRDLSIY